MAAAGGTTTVLPLGTALAPNMMLAIIATSFLVFAGINHIVEMVKKKNFSPGNTLVLIYDFGLPLSLWPLLCSAGVI
mgnify:CR=1 FL=1